LRLVRLEYVYEKGEWKEKETDAHEQTIRSGVDPLHVHLQHQGRRVPLTAQVRDDRERLNEDRTVALGSRAGRPSDEEG